MLVGAFHQTQDVSVQKRTIDVLRLAPSCDQRNTTSQNNNQLFAFQFRQSVTQALSLTSHAGIKAR